MEIRNHNFGIWKRKYTSLHKDSLIIAILLMMLLNHLVLKIEAIGQTTHREDNYLKKGTRMPTSTVRPWPSNKFFKKVLSSSKWKQTNSDHPPNLPKTETYNFRSHNHSTHATSQTNSSLKYKLSGQKQIKTGLAKHTDLEKNKIQNNRHTQYQITKRRPSASIVQVNNTQTTISGNYNNLKSESKNLAPNIEDDEIDEPQSYSHNKYSTHNPPYINRNNYGIGFQFEIDPGNSFEPVTPKPIRVMETSTRRNVIIHNTNFETFSSQNQEANERSDPWKRIPTFTVTVTPNPDLYSSGTSLKLITKRPQPPTLVHYPYPFKTKIKTTPSSLDYPLSPTFSSINPPTHTPVFTSESYFTPMSPLPFSPVAPQHVHIRPNLEHNKFPSSIIKQHEIAGVMASQGSASLNRPFTNIWYKPIINHFVSAITKTPNLDTIPNNNHYADGLVFKVWSYKNGKLTLVNENAIPAEAVEGFQLENGSILNLEQIPQAVQETVASAISQLNYNQQFQNIDTGGYNYNLEPNYKVSSGHFPDSPIISELDQYQKSVFQKESEQINKKNKTFVNYVIVDRKNFPTFDEINVEPTLKFAPVEKTSADFEQDDDPWSSFASTTYRPNIPETRAPQQFEETQDQWVDPLWQQLHSLLLSMKDIQMPTPIHRDPPTTTTTETPKRPIKVFKMNKSKIQSSLPIWLQLLS